MASKEESSEVDEDDPAPVLPSKRRISNVSAFDSSTLKRIELIELSATGWSGGDEATQGG